MTNDQIVEHDLERLVALIGAAEDVEDAAARERTQQIVQGVLDYHGAALARVVEILDDGAPRSVIDRLTDDKLVSSLLLLHDLHPDGTQARVERALDDVRPYLASHEGDVSLVSVNEGIVRLRMHGSCHGCPSSAVTLRTRIEEAIYTAAPEVMQIELSEESDASAIAAGGFVPLAALSGANSKAPA